MNTKRNIRRKNCKTNFNISYRFYHLKIYYSDFAKKRFIFKKYNDSISIHFILFLHEYSTLIFPPAISLDLMQWVCQLQRKSECLSCRTVIEPPALIEHSRNDMETMWQSGRKNSLVWDRETNCVFLDTQPKKSFKNAYRCNNIWIWINVRKRWEFFL